MIKYLNLQKIYHKSTSLFNTYLIKLSFKDNQLFYRLPAKTLLATEKSILLLCNGRSSCS